MNVSPEITVIVLTAALTTVGTVIALMYRTKKDAEVRSEDLERNARYLAIRVVCKIDPFMSECCNVVLDTIHNMTPV